MLDKVGNTINEGDTLQVDGRGTYIVHKVDGELFIDKNAIVPFISENSTVIKSAAKPVVEAPKARPVTEPLPEGRAKFQTSTLFDTSGKKIKNL